ncbi:unnamed protein product [Rhizophagus irregularis]|uniref:Uncharacterized protein n=1 Tax=Rhizophagus irregularis TaxID=588596 RepID=A0A915Z7F1_9GLOM|nr:unnamed protein product [Rhizophagus irregularis]
MYLVKITNEISSKVTKTIMFNYKLTVLIRFIHSPLRHIMSCIRSEESLNQNFIYSSFYMEFRPYFKIQTLTLVIHSAELNTNFDQEARR